MPDYDFPLWRPPSEGDNLIIQATLGCQFNGCTFCAMYKAKSFQVRPLDAVFADIKAAARARPGVRRVFLADGDAYTLPTGHLLAICARLRQDFPTLHRVSAYATPFNLLAKSADEIAALKQAGLSLVYVGVESGANSVLRAVGKGSAARMEQALARADEGGVKVSATVITGLGGQERWVEHVEETAALLSRVPVAYLSCLQLHVEPDMRDRFVSRFEGGFHWQGDRAILAEMRCLVDMLAPPRPVIFRSNHASNALALAGTLPKDRGRLLAQIDAALAMGDGALRPSWARGL